MAVQSTSLDLRRKIIISVRNDSVHWLNHQVNGLVQDCSINKTTCLLNTVYPKKYAHGFCFAVLCCGYTLTDFPISIRLTSLALWQSNDCPSPAKQPWWIWINTSCEFIMNDCITTTKQSTKKTVCIFLGIYCIYRVTSRGVQHGNHDPAGEVISVLEWSNKENIQL